MITTFNDYKKEYLVLNDDGEVKVKKQGLGGEYLANPCFDDFEQVWDFWEERSDFKKKLAYELAGLLENPIQMHFDFSKDDQSNEANLFRDNLHRINKIVEALKK